MWLKHSIASEYFISFLSAKAGVCRPPLFNEKAAVSSDCLRCFCFGVTETCYSSNLHTITVSTYYKLLLYLLFN